MTLTLASNGASKIYILGRRMDKLESVVKECAPGIVVPIECDITSKTSLDSAVQHVQSGSGYVNLVIANSGMVGPTITGMPQNPSVADIRKHIWNQEPEDFTTTFATNVTGMFYTIIAFLELLDAGNIKGNMPTNVKSQVIAISSIAAWNKTVGGGFAYNSSKAAVNHLVKMLSIYLVPHKIRVNAIAPGRKSL
jgi:NAD(P)-dependent dehydrogenase (short-subunit alcohol dehydrogenase family)